MRGKDGKTNVEKTSSDTRKTNSKKKKKEIRFPNANLNSTDSSIVSNDLKAKKKRRVF